MFTGLVQAVGTVAAVEPAGDALRLGQLALGRERLAAVAAQHGHPPLPIAT